MVLHNLKINKLVILFIFKKIVKNVKYYVYIKYKLYANVQTCIKKIPSYCTLIKFLTTAFILLGFDSKSFVSLCYNLQLFYNLYYIIML